jgi:hypothetical protein
MLHAFICATNRICLENKLFFFCIFDEAIGEKRREEYTKIAIMLICMALF